MPSSSPLPHKLINWGLLLLVVGIATWLRLRGLEHSLVGGDQSILLSIALRFVNQGGPMFPLAANKSSAGIMNPPLIEYLLALPLFLRTSLTAVHLFQALMSITAVFLLYIYTLPFFGRRVAFISSLLFAVNPWAVYYGRFLWNPNPIPLFSTLLLISLLRLFASGQVNKSASHLVAPSPVTFGCIHPLTPSSPHLPLSFFWLAAITQLHLSGLVLTVAVGLILLLFWRRWQAKNWQKTLMSVSTGLFLALLLYIPFIIYEQAVGFSDFQAAWAALTGNQHTESGDVGPAEVNNASWLLTQELATGRHIFAAAEIPHEAVWPWFRLLDIAQWLFVTALGYAIVAPIYWLIRQQGKPLPAHHTALVILAIWILVPVLLYVRHTVYLQNYYFLYLFPAPFLAIALGLETLMQRLRSGDWKREVLGYIVLVPVLLLCLWQFQVMNVWLSLMDEGAIEVERPFSQLEAAIYTTQTVLAERPDCDLTIVAEGGTAESSSLTVLEQFVYPTPVRFIDLGRGYIVPANCTTYLTVASDPLVDGWLANQATLLPQAAQVSEESWKFYAVKETAVSTQTPLITWQNGLALVDAKVSGETAANQVLTLQYTWLVMAPPPRGAHYHFFNHFLDESGQLVAQEDAPAIESLYWQPGDQLVTQFHLQMPAELENGRYTILVGLYTWPNLQRVSLPDGNTTYLVTAIEK